MDRWLFVYSWGQSFIRALFAVWTIGILGYHRAPSDSCEWESSHFSKDVCVCGGVASFPEMVTNPGFSPTAGFLLFLMCIKISFFRLVFRLLHGRTPLAFTLDTISCPVCLNQPAQIQIFSLCFSYWYFYFCYTCVYPMPCLEVYLILSCPV